MDQGSTRKRSAVHNFAPTVTKFCVMWEGQALPHDTKFGNSRCEIVGRRVIFIWSLIHGSSWSVLIKVGPAHQPDRVKVLWLNKASTSHSRARDVAEGIGDGFCGTSDSSGHHKSNFMINSSNLYWWGKGWPVDGLPFPDTGCPVPDVSIYYMSNINELPDGILFHWFCKCTPPWMFLPLDIPSEYRPEHVTFGLLCVIFKFPSRIFCRRVPGFATDCPCGVWCRGLTTCLLYVGPPLEF